MKPLLKNTTEKNEFSSIITLDDPHCVRIDDGPRSRAYFCQKTPLKVNQRLIQELKEIMATQIGNKNLRLCLHSSPEAPFHEMIIFERKTKYYRPHRHEDKGETFHIIEGEMGVFCFDDDGQVREVNILSKKGDLIYKIEAGMYHAVLPLTDIIIYYESHPGPFRGTGDSIYPSWAPDESNPEKVKEYTDRLRILLNFSV